MLFTSSSDIKKKSNLDLLAFLDLGLYVKSRKSGYKTRKGSVSECVSQISSIQCDLKLLGGDAILNMSILSDVLSAEKVAFQSPPTIL